MTKERIEIRMADIKKYLNRDWNGLSDNFLERLVQRIEYDNLDKQLKELENLEKLKKMGTEEWLKGEVEILKDDMFKSEQENNGNK